MRVYVKAELLQWACDRAGVTGYDVNSKYGDWVKGDVKPTFKQLEAFAKATHTPVGYLFLDAPPVEIIPIQDFRTMRDHALRSPSPDLLDTIHLCQQRQDWYRDYARANGGTSLDFVGSAKITDTIAIAATRMREAVGFTVADRARLGSFADALRHFVERADELGVLVMVNGVVGNNTSRKLDPEEFRGFALVDEWAPLVFINGADSKSAQMFTLAHELAHLWLGETALSDSTAHTHPTSGVERWCNEVAAELLVPLAAIKSEYQSKAELWSEVQRLAKLFKVSTLVVLRRIHDAGGFTKDEFWAAYQLELKRLLALKDGQDSGGGNFYATQSARVGKRLARALIGNTLEGHTLYRDALHLLGFSKRDTFEKLGRHLGVA